VTNEVLAVPFASDPAPEGVHGPAVTDIDDRTLEAQLPPLDREACVLSGVVVSGDGAGTPVTGAMLTLSGAALENPREAISDGRGRFGFTRLPAGMLALRASKSGFVTAVYGARLSNTDVGVSIAVRPEVPSNVVFKIVRAAAIEGIILTPTGTPVPRTVVKALPSHRQASDGLLNAALDPQPMAVSDDRGEYRIANLAPGAYVVVALPSASVLPPIGNVASAARGDQPISAYVPVFHPGVTSLKEAVALELLEGDERTSVNFVPATAPVTDVRLRVVGLDGRTPDVVEVHYSLTSLPIAVRDMLRWSAPQPGTAGSFSIAGLTPGRYVFSARAAPTVDSSIRPSQSHARTLGGSAELIVDGQQAVDLQIMLDEGVQVSGRVVLDGSSSDNGGALVILQPESDVPIPPPPVNPVRTSPDGSFALAGVTPGKYWLTAMKTDAAPPGDRWFLESSLLNGRDTRDVPIEVHAGRPLSGAVLTLTKQPAQISGTLRDASGRATSDCFVVAFPSNDELWTPDSPRFPPAVLPSTDGHYLVRDLPPGEYVLAAVSNIDPRDWRDPALLRALTASGIKVAIGAHEAKTVDLNVTSRASAREPPAGPPIGCAR
jgi:hypothetical protein